ncbi:MAG: hypothetical protein K0R25_902 [Rickettsiaceae bacterium]|jgi:hypothetical protein|nr:hypothetical protein [Rickettsiaceae bacterium]
MPPKNRNEAALERMRAKAEQKKQGKQPVEQKDREEQASLLILDKAKNAYDKDDYVTAIKCYNQAISWLQEGKIKVNEPHLLYFSRSLAHGALKNYQAQITDTTAALKNIDPQNPLFNKLLSDRFEAYKSLRNNEGKGYDNEIKNDGNNLLRRLRNNPKNKPTIDNIHITLGKIAYHARQYYESYTHLSRLAEDKRTAEDDFILARSSACLLEEEDKTEWGEKALHHIKHLTNKGGDPKIINLLKGIALRHLGKITYDAQQYYECYTRLSQLAEDERTESDYLLLTQACISLLKAEDKEWGEKALHHIEHLIIKDCDEAVVHYLKGMAIQYKSADEAINHLEQALKSSIFNKLSGIHIKLTDLYRGINDLGKAKQHLLYAIGKMPLEKRESFTLSEYLDLTEDVEQSLASENSSATTSNVTEGQDIYHPPAAPEPEQNPIDAVSQDIAEKNTPLPQALEIDNPSTIVKSTVTTSAESSAAKAEVIEDEEKNDPLPQKKISAKSLVDEKRKQNFEKLRAKFPEQKSFPLGREKQVFTWNIKMPEKKEGEEPDILSSKSEEIIHQSWGWGLPKDNTLFIYFDEESPSVKILKHANPRAYEALKRIVNYAHIVPPDGKQGIKLIEIDGKKCWEAKILGTDGKGEIRIFARVEDSTELTAKGNPAAQLLVFDSVEHALHKNKSR